MRWAALGISHHLFLVPFFLNIFSSVMHESGASGGGSPSLVAHIQRLGNGETLLFQIHAHLPACEFVCIYFTVFTHQKNSKAT